MSEFSTLLADVKEHILYLRELGAENFAVDLPEFLVSPNSKVQSSKPEISREKLGRFVPSDFELPKIESPKHKTSNAENNSSRQSLLESTKLSRLPSLPKRVPDFRAGQARLSDLIGRLFHQLGSVLKELHWKPRLFA